MTYEEFINNILETRGRNGCSEEYHETHHIVPKCMGGNNDKENLIDLFAREHFEAHRLLALENPEEDSLILAWTMMAWAKNDNEKRYKVTAEEYESAKIALSQIQSKLKKGCNNPMYGKTTKGYTGHKHSIEVRKKISESNKNPSEETRQKMSKKQKERWTDELKEEWSKKMSGESNPFYGRTHSEETKEKLKKRIVNEDTRDKISKANKGRVPPNKGKPMYEEQKQKLRRPKTDEEKRKNSESHRGLYSGAKNPSARAVQCIETGEILYGAKAFKDKYGINESSICMCCRGKYKTAGGYHWRYADKVEEENLKGEN